MRILITGGGGNLGRVLAPALEEAGHEPVLMDNRNLETPYRSVRGDVRDGAEVLEALRGYDVVVHAAALHGIHLDKYTSDGFWNLNVVGTRNVYEAARECGVGKVLLCSTIGIYGEGVREAGDPPVISEDLSLKPSDVYGLSKKLCEEMAAFYERRHGIRTIAYRLGMFVPESFVAYGIRLLKGGVDDRDVAQAFLLGLEDTTISFDTFNVMAEVPFSVEEFGRWSREPETLLEQRFPGVARLVEEQGADFGELVRMWGFTYWSIEKAKRVLGYRSRYNFPEFFEALKRGDRSHYPYADLPWWGV
ncbi:MAG: NAD(P)-dependent oxidoreductase [Actinomycetota bacterium]|nr:NAD(P)-dependent oxidoreductase [Actinomycetota bacterium]